MSYFYDDLGFEEEPLRERHSSKRSMVKKMLWEKQSWKASELAEELPSIHDVLADLLLTEEVTAHTTISAGGVVFHMSPDEIMPCGHTVCISVKYSRWDDAENDAYLLKKSGYNAWVDTESDKPHLIVELKPLDTIRFTLHAY